MFVPVFWHFNEISQCYGVQTRGCILYLLTISFRNLCLFQLIVLTFFDKQRYHAYFMEEVDSWMIISAGSFLHDCPSLCSFWNDCMSLIVTFVALISSVQLVVCNQYSFLAPAYGSCNTFLSLGYQPNSLFHEMYLLGGLVSSGDRQQFIICSLTYYLSFISVLLFFSIWSGEF